MRTQLPHLSRFDIQRQRAIFYPLDLLHMMANLFKHPPDLPVLAFDERDLIPGILGIFGQPDLRRRGENLLHVAWPTGIGGFTIAGVDAPRSRFCPDANAPAEFFNVLCGRSSRNLD